jgi:galactosamine-6-phosphate isomerase
MSNDLSLECRDMDTFVRASGGIDLMVVGVGMNGHIGFNEPGVSWTLSSHVIGLDEKTQTVGQKYFTEPTTLKQGITLGLQHFMDAKKALVLANGPRKADIMRRVLHDGVSSDVPASIVHQHAHGIVMLDRAAAGTSDK